MVTIHREKVMRRINLQDFPWKCYSNTQSAWSPEEPVPGENSSFLFIVTPIKQLIQIPFIPINFVSWHRFPAIPEKFRRKSITTFSIKVIRIRPWQAFVKLVIPLRSRIVSRINPARMAVAQPSLNGHPLRDQPRGNRNYFRKKRVFLRSVEQ